MFFRSGWSLFVTWVFIMWVFAAALSLPFEFGFVSASALRSLHSRLCPARHAASWQAWVQYLNCRHPVHRCRLWVAARAPQSAPVRVTAVQIAGAVVGRLDRSVVAWCSGVASPARGW